MVLQSHVRKRAALLGAGKKPQVFKEKACSEVALFHVVQIWVSYIFHDNVRNHDLPDISGILGCGITSQGNKTFLDLQGSVEMGL